MGWEKVNGEGGPLAGGRVYKYRARGIYVHIDRLYDGYPLFLIPCMHFHCVYNKYIGTRSSADFGAMSRPLPITIVHPYGIELPIENTSVIALSLDVSVLQKHIRSSSEAVVSLLVAVGRNLSSKESV